PLVFLAWFGFLLQFSGTDTTSFDLVQRWGLASPPARFGLAEVIALVGASQSLIFAISIAGTVTAHELVHRTWSPASLLAGRVLLAFIFDAAFSVEHVYGHHARVGTVDDPATARRGENVYAFFLRSSVQSFRSAWRIERERLARRGYALWSWRNRNLRGI